MRIGTGIHVCNTNTRTCMTPIISITMTPTGKARSRIPIRTCTSPPSTPTRIIQMCITGMIIDRADHAATKRHDLMRTVAPRLRYLGSPLTPFGEPGIGVSKYGKFTV
jgi:hypothetical protein